MPKGWSTPPSSGTSEPSQIQGLRPRFYNICNRCRVPHGPDRCIRPPFPRMRHPVHQGQPLPGQAVRCSRGRGQAHRRSVGPRERREGRRCSGGIPSGRSEAVGGGVRLYIVVDGGRPHARRQEGDTGCPCHGPGHGPSSGRGPVPCHGTGMLMRPHAEARPGIAGVRAHGHIHPR